MKEPFLLEARKKRLVWSCGGGGIKAAAFHLGSAFALQDLGVVFPGDPRWPDGPLPIQGFSGVSGGSLLAAYLVAGFLPQEILVSYLGDQAEDFFQYRKEKGPLLEVRKTFPPFSSKQLFHLSSPSLSEIRSASKAFLEAFRARAWSQLFQIKGLKWLGFFSTQGLQKHIEQIFLQHSVAKNDSFDAQKIPFFVVATPLESIGKVIFGPSQTREEKSLKKVTISQACAASSSIPGVFSPFLIEGQSYLDGELVASFPLSFLKQQGFSAILATAIHRPFQQNVVLKKPEDKISPKDKGIPKILVQGLYQMVYEKIQDELEREKILSIFQKSLQAEEKEVQKRILESLKSFGVDAERESCVEVVFPEHSNTDRWVDFFFQDHLKLPPTALLKVVKLGYESTWNSLRVIN